ncbi:MAG: bifunctional glutamine-synthetase adenylyltransferase/deadenyltransferase [Actinobacteria bacterium]|nr:bifunctional glutamine-synthetase adenylyltransferase/deadenyltransferase [Actinomycetota bacterium]
MISPEELGRALAGAPDPQLARVALSRVTEHPRARAALERPDVLGAAIPLLGFSPAAVDLLVAHPEEAEALAELGPRSRGELDAELAADTAAHGPEDGLRRFRRRAMLRVAARDLAGAALDDVVAEITALAESCLAEACRRVAPEGGLAVVGLGKLGGAELNYSSDVDVVFVHTGTGGERQEWADRAAARLIRLLSEPTGEGVALRVDAALRPGGRSGALSRSLDAMAEHYARHAATWERQALLKARPVAGDLELGAAFLEAVVGQVFPDELAPRAIEEVRATKVRIEDYVRARGKELVEVKRGRGGIRDVEFAVQLLQLVHGRRNARLREPNTLRALAALAEEGYVAEQDAEDLADAYRFLRRLEHRLQIVRDLQTHELPADPSALGRLARSMGLRSAEALRAVYEEETELVRGIHERLFYRPLLEAFAGAPAPRPGVEREATEELLAGLGFVQPESAYQVLARLVDPSTRLGRVMGHVFPVVVPAMALAANPDAALVRLDRVLEAAGSNPEVADALASDPRGARLLAHAVAVSSFATDLLASRPAMLPALAPGSPGEEDPGTALVRVVGEYAARELEPKQVGAALTRIGDAVIGRALGEAGSDVPFAVVGLGKLGARELNFASDLDVVFVYEEEGREAFERAQRVAERVLAGVREAGWEPDADLRPEGRAGPLARSVAGFLEYWERWAEPWEFQSLLRARHVAGDEVLGRRFEALAEDLAYPPGLTVDRLAEMLRMRRRIERERVRPREAARFHFKLGYGSLADVQFAVEAALMRHGHEHPEIRRRGTLEAVEALAEARLIEDSVALALGEAFVFLNDVKNALEVDRRVHAEAVPAGTADQLALARRLGYEEYPRQSFLEEYRRVTRRARLAMERVFSEVGE